ncbi:MAG: hypothetical protein KA734_08130 [Fluviicola sp.]|nr:hypothetical protein [Fluviicola sp.]MBP6271653.1 hypothetical protein [Fluviicola sp.]
MNFFINKYCIISALVMLLMGCDSSSDPITPTPVPSTLDFIYIKAPNAASGNAGFWELKKEVTAGIGFTSPITLRSDDFSTVASTIPSATVMSKQCSAYDKVSKRYAVSSGERVIVYNFTPTLASTIPIIEFQYNVSSVQAMEFVNGRFFVILNNEIKEYDVATGTVLSSFTPITLASGQVSNITQKGDYLAVISGGKLYMVNITGTGSMVAGYPYTFGTTDSYEGLEMLYSGGAYSLYVVKRNSSGNEFQQIDINASFNVSAVNTKYVLTFTNDITSKISSAVDYTTEFYYLISNNCYTCDSFSATTIDLTPTNPSTYSPTTLTAPGNHYVFGLQLKD